MHGGSHFKTETVPLQEVGKTGQLHGDYHGSSHRTWGSPLSESCTLCPALPDLRGQMQRLSPQHSRDPVAACAFGNLSPPPHPDPAVTSTSVFSEPPSHPEHLSPASSFWAWVDRRQEGFKETRCDEAPRPVCFLPAEWGPVLATGLVPLS